jgi:hypothetical protein
MNSAELSQSRADELEERLILQYASSSFQPLFLKHLPENT